MKKTTRILGILLIAAMLLSALSLGASASQPIAAGPFTVQATDQIAIDPSTGETANYGAEQSTFEKIEYTVIDSQTIRFDYALWLKNVGSGSTKHYDASVTLNGYSCDADIRETFDITYAYYQEWTYKIVITKAAGHVYDNACDTDCNICGATRTITHAYENGVCTVCGDVCAHTAVDGAGICTNCKSQIVASVMVGGATTNYLDIYEAAAYAASQDNSTIVLLSDVDLGEGDGLFDGIRDKKNVTLDLNGKTIQSYNSYTIYWQIYGHEEEHVTLTINDSVGTGKVVNGKFNAVEASSNLVINGGTYEAGLGNNTQAFAVSIDSNALSYGDTLTINGGSFKSNNGIYVSTLAYCVINNGTFEAEKTVIHSGKAGQLVIKGGNFPGGITCAGYNDPLAQLLAPDYYVKNAEGKIVSTENVTNIKGSVTVSKGTDLQDAVVTVDSASVTYNGIAHEPAATVTIDGRTVDPAHYTVSYANNTNVGEATVTVTAKGDIYTGSKTATFIIEKATPTAEHFNITLSDHTYSGEAKELGVELKSPYTGMGQWTLVITKDGQEVTEMKDAGRYIVTLNISDGDNFTALDGLEIADFHIYPDMLSSADVALSADKVTYSGDEQKPTVTVTANGMTLVSGQDYDLVWDTEDFINAGAKKVTITGKGNYDGTVVVTYTIKRKLLTADNITLSFTEATYDGNIHRPTFVVMDGDKELVSGVDFEHSWNAMEPVDAGTYFLRINIYGGNYYVDPYVDKNFVIHPATPDLTLTTPSPSIGPGQNIIMSVVAANPHNAELTDLPTEFKLTYKVGENGTPVTVSGLTFTLPAETALGETVYVWVQNAAVDGKYAVGTSNTVEIFVGQVDYTAAIKALEEQIAQLEADHGADVTELEKALAELEEAVSKLDENGYATDAELAAAKAELSGAISDLAEDIAALSNVYATIDALNAAKQELQNAITANETDIEAKVAALTKALEDAKTALETAYKAADETLKTALEQQIGDAKTTLQAAIDKVAADLEKARQELQAAIDTKASSEELTKAIEDLNKAIEAAKKFATDEDAKLKEALEAADAALEAAIKLVQENLDKAVEDLKKADKDNADALAQAIIDLNAAIEAAEAAAAAEDAAIRGELAAARASLNSAIATLRNELYTVRTELVTLMTNEDAVLNGKITDLAATLEAAVAALEAADEANKAELTAAIADAEATLTAAIEQVAADLAAARQLLTLSIANGDKALHGRVNTLTAALEAAITAAKAADVDLSAELEAAVATLNAAIGQVQQALEQAKTDLTAKDAALDAKDAQLQKLVIVAIVIASVGVAGCVALLVYIIVDKRKKV